MNLIKFGAKLAILPTDLLDRIVTEMKVFTDLNAYRDEIARYEGELRQNAPQTRIKDVAQETPAS